MRLFFAVALPQKARSVLASLRFRHPDYRWVEPDLVHLTLLFLGEQPESVLPDLNRAASHVAATHEPGQLHLGAPGQFGPSAAPRVLWVGIAGDLTRLRSVQSALVEALASVVPSTDWHPFAPHLTLARRRSFTQRSTAPVPWPPGQMVEPLSVPFESLLLVQSVLSPSGPHYMPLTNFVLGRLSGGLNATPPAPHSPP